MKVFTIEDVTEKVFNKYAKKFNFYFIENSGENLITVDGKQISPSHNGSKTEVELYNLLSFETKLKLHGKIVVNELNEDALANQMEKISKLIEDARVFANKTDLSFSVDIADGIEPFYNGEWHNSIY